jgi:hypothetical protein
MADFTLNDLGQIELGEFGEETEEFIRDHCYPELEAVLSHDNVMPTDGGDYSTEAKETIRQAVEFEKLRLWRDQPQGPDAKTELGKEIQARMGTTGIVADHYVKIGAKRLLKSKLGEDAMEDIGRKQKQTSTLRRKFGFPDTPYAAAIVSSASTVPSSASMSSPSS